VKQTLANPNTSTRSIPLSQKTASQSISTVCETEHVKLVTSAANTLVSMQRNNGVQRYLYIANHLTLLSVFLED